MKETVSFDVFDTVVTRSFAHPRDLFVHLGNQLQAAGVQPLPGLDFARIRWTAELEARKRSPYTEVLLDDIYGVIARRLGWDAPTTQRARDMELALEARHLHGIPRILPRLAAARARAGRIVFLSDMYLPSAVLRPWLAREGVLASEDLLLISGEARANKSSGRLFEVARETTGGDFAHWQHLGDHPFADVEKPAQLGIAAVHLPDAHLTAAERLARGPGGEFAVAWRSLLAGAMRLARLEQPPGTDRDAVLWDTGATVAGPLFYGFVRWTLAEAKRRGLRRLYFLARDGQIFWRIARAIEGAEPTGVECRYLQVSRLSLAGLAELDAPDALRWLAAPTGHFHSISQTLRQLGLDEAWARQHLPAPHAAADFDANLPPADREALADWLLAPERRETVRAALHARAAHARAYLAAEGVLAGEPIGVVDTGWLGSIHRNLELLLGNPGQPAPLPGFYLGLMPAGAKRPAGEMLGYTNQFAPLPILREESHKVLIELMAQSDHGQVLGYQQAGNAWQPQLNAAGPVNLDEIRRFQDAILAFVRRALATAADAAGAEDQYARIVIAGYRRFHDEPTAAQVRVFGFLPHADQLFEQRHATLVADFTGSELFAALRDYRLRPPHWWVAGQAALGHGGVLRAFRSLKRLWWRLRLRQE